MAQNSWRESVSKSVQEDFDDLFDDAIELAAQHICTTGSTPIFAITKENDVNGAVYQGDNETVLTMRNMGRLLSDESEQIRSAVIVSEVHSSSSSARMLAFHFDSREVSIQITQGFDAPDSETFNLADDMKAGAAEALVSF